MESIDHTKITGEKLIEMYLMQQLTGEEETAFENHLLFCPECRIELQRQEKILAAIDQSFYRRTFGDMRSGTKKTTGTTHFIRIVFHNRMIRIAASVIILLGLSGLVYFLSVQKSERSMIADETEKNRDNREIIIPPDSLPFTPESSGETEKDQSDDQSIDRFAENFTPHPLYEQMADNLVRSGNLSMIEPADSVSINSGERITFAWQSGHVEEFELNVLMNTGEILYKIKVKSPFEFRDFNTPGLYYWKLDTREETVAAGKIYVR